MADIKTAARHGAGCQSKQKKSMIHPILTYYPRPRRNRRRHSQAKRVIAYAIRFALIAATITAAIIYA